MDVKKLQLNGMELVDPNAEYSGEQIFYLDFNGTKNASYDNEALNIHVNGFDVADSGLDQERINKIISELNTTFAGTGVHFTVTPPDSSLLTPHSSLASTIYIGNAGNAFAQYGNFLGLAETIDAGNQIKTDDAFVFADKTVSNATIAETITHEAGHLIGFQHEGKDGTVDNVNDFAAAGDITSVASQLGNFRFIAGNGIDDLFNTFTATVSAGATEVAFEVGGQTIRDTNGSDGWSVKVNMSDCINTNDLVVKSYAGSSLLDTYNVDINLLMLPDWLQKANAHVEKVSVTPNNGYSISIYLEDFNKEVFTPDDWKWTVPYFKEPLLDISKLRTGIDGRWYLTIKSDANGAVSLTDSEYHLGMEILGEKIIDKYFILSGGKSSGANLETSWKNANITVDASGDFNIAFGLNIDNNLQLTDGASCSTQLNMDFDTTIQSPSVSLTASSGLPSWLASIDANLAFQIGVDFNLETTAAFSIKDGFYLSNATIAPDIDFHAILTGEANVVNGIVANGGIILDAYVLQNLTAKYIRENPTPWDFAAPGSLNLDSKLYWDTLFTDPGNKNLFSLKLAEWDFLNQASTPTPNNVNQGYLAPSIGSVTPSSTNITQRQNLVITANNVTGTDIAYVEFSANGNVIATDKNAADGWSFSANTAQSGTYTFSAQAYNSLGIASNKVAAASQVKINAADNSFEPNNTQTQATDLGIIEGNLYLSKDLGLKITSGDVDFYKFTITSTGTKNDEVHLYMKDSVDAKGTRDLDLALGKLNNNNKWCPVKGQWFDSWSATDKREEVISLEGLDAGTYYAIVYGATATNYYFDNYNVDKVLHFEKGMEENTYSLIINAPMVDAFESDNDWINAKNIAIDGSKQIHSLPANDIDWVKFEIRDVYDTNINLSGFVSKEGTTLNSVVSLYKANNAGAAITNIYNPKIGVNGAPLTMTQRLSPGTYYIKVDCEESNDIKQYDISISGTIANHSPVVANPILDQTLSVGQLYNYIIPIETFDDADNDTLSLSVLQADGSSLPTWLTFDPNTRTLSGTPSQDGKINIKVIANDGKNDPVYDIFDLSMKTLLAGPTGLSVEFDNNRDITFKWTAPANMTVDHYVLTLFDVSGNPITIDLQSKETSILRESPKPGEFTWHVKAVDAAGNESAWSQSGSFAVDVNNYLPVPKNVVQNLDKNQVAFDWSDVNHAAKYEIQVDTHSDFGNTLDLYQTTTTSEINSTLANGTYYYRVRASNEYGNSAWSEAKSFTVDGNITRTVIYASDTAPGSSFGKLAAVFGDVFATAGNNPLRSYVYRWDGTKWNETKFTPDTGDGKIATVATSGNTVVIGQETYNGEHSGNAFVYRWDGSNWNEFKITSPTGSTDDWFAQSVAITGDTVVISADSYNNSTGAAYIYQWNGASWSNGVKLIVADKAEGDGFGRSIAAYGDTMVIGAPGDDDKGENSGSAYIYQRNGSSWNFVQKLTSSDTESTTGFGEKVAIAEDLIVVGTSEWGSNDVYVYRKNGIEWDETKFTPAADTPEDDCVGSVAASGDTFVVGLWDSMGRAFGSALVYHWNGATWDKTQLTGFSNKDDYSGYGRSVSISGSTVVIGEGGNDASGESSGCVYVYNLDFGDMPDLVFNGALTVSKTTMTVGDSFIVSGALKNTGAANAGTSTLYIYKSVDGAITKDDSKIGDISISAININGSQFFTSASISTAGWAAGTYYIGSIADFNDNVKEGVKGETNNISSAVKITVNNPCDKVFNSANGHYYQVVYVAGGINWDAAKAEAEAAGGYLATITSTSENQFVKELGQGQDQGVYIGGYQPEGSTEPGGGWIWANGETWNYSSWSPNEPNQHMGYNEDYLDFNFRDGYWNDVVVNNMDTGYIIEWGTADITPPPAPASLTRTVTGNNVALDWADSSDSGSGIKNYLLEYALNAQFTGASQRTFSVSNANVSKLADGTYYWRVQANDNSGNASAWATGGSFVIDITAPSAPNSLTRAVTGNNVALDWADSTDATSGVKNYLFQYATNALFTGATQSIVTVSNANVSKLVDGTYYWRVQANDNSGNASTWATGRSFVIDITAPSVPATLSRTVTGHNAALDWADATDATSGIKQYEYQVDNNADFTSNEKSGTAVVSNASVSGLADGNYYWRVRTQDKSGNYSAWVSGSGFMVDVTAPSVPASLTQTVAGNNVALDWADSTDAPSGVKQYQVQLDKNADFSSPDYTASPAVSGANFNGLADGTYFWRVRTQDNAGNYSAWNNGASFVSDVAGNVGAALLFSSPSITGLVGLNDPADYYKLIMTNPGTLTLGLTGLTGDANLSLLDSKGKVLKTSANRGTVNETIGNYLLLSGTYYVKVAAVPRVNSATYTLTHAETYFPADKAANTWQTAKDISTLDNWVGYGDVADFYKLTMTNAGMLNLGLTGLTGDSSLSLLDSKGKVLKNSSNRLNAAEAIAANLQAGTYYVKVAAATGVNSATYTLTNTKTYFPVDKATNAWQAAKDIATLDNWVGFGDSADCYKLIMTQNGKLALGLTGLNGDVNLSLLDSKGRVLKTSANRGLVGEAISMDLLSGTYYVNVAPVRGVNSANYTLIHAETYFPADTAGNAFASARQVTTGGTVNEWLGFGDKDDYYKFELKAAAAATFNLSGMSSNVNLYLYDGKKRQLAASAKPGNTAESITKTLAAGTYYVKATLAGRDNTNYALSFNIDPAAFKSGSLKLFGASSPSTSGSDSVFSSDPLKKNQGMLAS